MSFLKRFFRSSVNYIKKKQGRYCTAVIVAAGSASRMQGTDKIMTHLDGEPVICHTLRTFQQCDCIKSIVVVTREELLETIADLCKAKEFGKVSAVVCGGESRVHSVMNGLLAAPKKTNFVAIHDGARPLVTETVIAATVEKAYQTGAAAPAVPVKDTVKIAKGGLVVNTPDRKSLFAVQTPQTFDYDLICAAVNNALTKKLPVTDDCSAAEAFGYRIHLTEGSEENIKITTPFDLALAAAILTQRRPES